MLDVRDLYAAYGESMVLQGASVRVGAGQVAAVLGRNGVGKTTLIRAIGGLMPARGGTVMLKGENVTGLPAHEIARRGVGMVPQGRRVFPSLDVREHLLVGHRLGNASGWNLERVLALFPRLSERLRHKGGKLSGGEQAMLACGRALVGNPDVVLMDEPSEGLAPLLVRELARVIGELRAAGTAILLIEHDMDVALALAERVVVLHQGRVLAEGTQAEIRQDPRVAEIYLGTEDA